LAGPREAEHFRRYPKEGDGRGEGKEGRGEDEGRGRGRWKGRGSELSRTLPKIPDWWPRSVIDITTSVA